MKKNLPSDDFYHVREISTIKDFLEYSAINFSKKTAYMYKENHKAPFTKISFGTFKKQVDGLGTALIDMGFKDANMAILGENSYYYPLAYFAVSCGVGTVVPIDRYLELEEIENLIMRADVQVIFSDLKSIEKIRPLLDRIESLSTIICMNDYCVDDDNRIISMDEVCSHGFELIKNGDFSYIDAIVKPEDISTILFTSGTTGLAKGVVLTHANIASNVMNMSRIFNVPVKTRVLSVLPMHHTYEMTCSILTAFYQGATIVICEGLKYILDNFKEAKCGVFLGVPLIFEKMHKKIFREAKKTGQLEKLNKGIELSKKFGLHKNKFLTGKLFKSIRNQFGKHLYYLIVGGAAIEPKVIEDFQVMGIPIIQGYGMTENSPLISVNPPRHSKPDSVGIALPGTEIKIINSDSDGIGEIILKGPSVMRGYYKDEKTTSETIIDGWLHTGDYGYLDSEGYLYVTGRKKNVIVTKNGKNIFPEELEYYLLQNPDILETLVYGKSIESSGDLSCTALIYPDFKLLTKKGIKTNEDIYLHLLEIVNEVNKKCPQYKHIKRIEIRDTDFAKTTTQKIKRFDENNYTYIYDDDTFRSKSNNS